MSFCFNCGNRIEEGMKFCPKCGQKIAAVETEATQGKPKDVRSNTLIIERAEPTYYSDQKGVRITPTRLITPGKTRNEGPSTYAMANITSVKTEKEGSKRWVGIVIAGIGVLLIAVGSQPGGGATLILPGVILLGLGVVLAVLLKPTYHLRVASSSGETEPLSSKDKQYIDHVVTALNEALIKRG